MTGIVHFALASDVPTADPVNTAAEQDLQFSASYAPAAAIGSNVIPQVDLASTSGCAANPSRVP